MGVGRREDRREARREMRAETWKGHERRGEDGGIRKKAGRGEAAGQEAARPQPRRGLRRRRGAGAQAAPPLVGGSRTCPAPPPETPPPQYGPAPFPRPSARPRKSECAARLRACGAERRS